MSFLRKATIELVNVVCNNKLFYFLAKKMGWFDAVFVMYPADEDFADYFTFRFRQKLITWSPFIVGVIVHPNKKRTLMLAVSAFVDRCETHKEAHNLRLLHDKVLAIKRYIGAKSTHFAGTLPGRFIYLATREKEDKKNEQTATVESVVFALRQLRTQLSHAAENPVIVLGSNGYIGREVCLRLERLNIAVTKIDKKEGRTSYTKPLVPHIVLNITAPEAINGYLGCMNQFTILVNEVYPAPHPQIVAELALLGVKVFHIAGVRAMSWPPFPGAYEGAIPCCAAFSDCDLYEVALTELT